MRVAAIYDIHGNLPALEAVVDDIRRSGVDEIVVGGDVLPGPMPRETLAFLAELDIPTRYIRGNGDRAVLEQLTGVEPITLAEQYREVVRWTASQLGEEHARVLASWPRTLRIEIDGAREVLFCHATPRSDTELFTRLTSDERLTPVFEGVGAGLVVCGHTHMQFDRMVAHTRLVNAGSVGMPFGEPGAYWLRLGPDVELRRTMYDLDAAAARIRATSYPRASEFAEREILQPRSEAEMLELFGHGE